MGYFCQVKKNLSECLYLSSTAPLCAGALFDGISFLVDTEAMQQILEGTDVFLAGTDQAMKILLKETAITYSKLSQEEVATYVTADNFQYYWQGENERISSL